jgi:hypothetical protein
MRLELESRDNTTFVAYMCGHWSATARTYAAESLTRRRASRSDQHTIYGYVEGREGEVYVQVFIDMFCRVACAKCYRCETRPSPGVTCRSGVRLPVGAPARRGHRASVQSPAADAP